MTQSLLEAVLDAFVGKTRHHYFIDGRVGMSDAKFLESVGKIVPPHLICSFPVYFIGPDPYLRLTDRAKNRNVQTVIFPGTESLSLDDLRDQVIAPCLAALESSR